MTLGDQGAEVIKVERPSTGDDTRTWGPPFVGGESAYYLCCNRNKKSVTIDFSKPEGSRLIRDLAEKSDVVIENFKPGLLKRFGLHWEALEEVNPRLVYCSVTAYGQDGPYQDRPGYDMVLSAVGGLMGLTGPRGDGEPCKVGVAITDILTGVHAANAITAALFWRERSGVGQHLDCSLLDVQVASLANIASNWLVAGQEAQRWGTAHESIVPYQVFMTQDRPLALAVASQKLWKAFCTLIDREEWVVDPRFHSNPARVEHRDVLIPLIGEVLREKTVEDWMELFVEASIPCGPVNTMESLFSDPQLLHRNMIQEVHHPSIGALKLTGMPVKFSRTPSRVDTAPPLLGQHTEEVLEGLLGLSEDEIGALRDAKVV